MAILLYLEADGLFGKKFTSWLADELSYEKLLRFYSGNELNSDSRQFLKEDSESNDCTGAADEIFNGYNFIQKSLASKELIFPRQNSLKNQYAGYLKEKKKENLLKSVSSMCHVLLGWGQSLLSKTSYLWIS